MSFLLTYSVYLSATEVCKRHHNHSERAEHRDHHGALPGGGHVPDVAVHGDAEQRVAAAQHVHLGQA